MHITETIRRPGEAMGVDNLNDYYDVSFKEPQFKRLLAYAGFRFKKLDAADHDGIKATKSQRIRSGMTGF